jgi:hypothetical protein
MTSIPFFVEAAENRLQPNLQVCHWIMGALFKHHIQPLPLATSPVEANLAMTSLKRRNIKASVFVINSYLAEDLMNEIDPLIGDTPAVILRRDNGSGFYLTRKKEILETTILLQRRQGRQTALCPYGSTNSHYVADCVAQCLLKFLADEDFWHFAPLSALATSALRP